MLARHLNEKVKNNLVVKGSIVQLLEYLCDTAQDPKIIIVLNMQVLESRVEIIGDPKHLDAGGEQQADLPNPRPGPGPGGVPQQQPPACVSMAPNLTADAFLALTSGAIAVCPVLQIIDILRTGNAQTAAERFQLVLSDGVNFHEVMLATHLNDKVENNLAGKGSIVQLLEFMWDTAQDPKIIVVLDMQVVEWKAEIVGDPKHLDAGGQQQAALPNPRLGPGLGGVQQQQPPACVSVLPSVADATNSSNGFRSAGRGLGQTLGTEMDNGAGRFNMGQAPSGGQSSRFLSSRRTRRLVRTFGEAYGGGLGFAGRLEFGAGCWEGC